MSTITTIQSTDAISASRSTINTNFANLNTDKAELSGATFTGDINVPDEAYGVAWNGSTEVPTKNAIYDKIETMGGGGATTFLGLTDTPSSYVGQALKVVQVNAGATGLEFVTASGGGDALTANPLSQFASTTSAQLAGVISDETGSGSLVFANSPTLTTPNLGTPSALTLTNATGLPVAGITASTTQALGVGSIELGHATDTTISRVSAGRIAVEGEVLNGYATTATAAGTTTLTVASARVQHFTGTTTQTVVLPTTSVVVGQQYEIVNRSTGLVTVQSSGLNTIVTLGLNQKATVTALVATPTTAANWSYEETNLSGNSQGKRILVVTQSATPAINTNNGDIIQITGLAQAITSMSSGLTGNPVAGDMLMIQITDNGTARAITWGASFASTTVSLPTTTVVSTMLRVLFQRNNANTLWDCISVA